MKLEFLSCGSPTDAFWSQAAMFRLQLDALGEPYSSARQVLCLGAPEPGEVPARWQPFFRSIEVQWVRNTSSHFDAQSRRLYALADPRADLSILCDADTLLLRPLPQDFLETLVLQPAICGVIAHYPPPVASDPGAAVPPLPGLPQMWDALSARILGRPIARTERYTLDPEHPERAPFYVNHGVIIAPPGHLRRLATQIREVMPEVRAVVDNAFCYQLAIPYAVERSMIRWRALPMRYNFPNDPICDRLYPAELDNIVFMHYLRTDIFDRHHIFAERAEFERFMGLSLQGSNAVFRDCVRTLTGGRYPFDA